MKLRLTTGLLITLTCSGCLIVPYRTDESRVIKGHVSDLVTGHPVSKAKIFYLFPGTHYRTSAETFEDGTFEVGPIHQWHWLLYLGDPGMVPAPAWMFDLLHRSSKLTIDAPGYQPTNVWFQSESYIEGKGANAHLAARDSQTDQYQLIKMKPK